MSTWGIWDGFMEERALELWDSQAVAKSFLFCFVLFFSLPWPIFHVELNGLIRFNLPDKTEKHIFQHWSKIAIYKT